MARAARTARLDAPRGRGRIRMRSAHGPRDRFGRFAETFARYMGTPQFLVGMTVLIVVWVAWNTLAPESLRFDKPWFILLNLLFSVQASYAAPLILLAQNRQDDRDRVQIEQDRQRAERNLGDTEYLAREMVALRLALTDLTGEIMTRDALRQELRAMLERLDGKDGDGAGQTTP